MILQALPPVLRHRLYPLPDKGLGARRHVPHIVRDQEYADDGVFRIQNSGLYPPLLRDLITVRPALVQLYAPSVGGRAVEVGEAVEVPREGQSY